MAGAACGLPACPLAQKHERNLLFTHSACTVQGPCLHTVSSAGPSLLQACTHTYTYLYVSGKVRGSCVGRQIDLPAIGLHHVRDHEAGKSSEHAAVLVKCTLPHMVVVLPSE